MPGAISTLRPREDQRQAAGMPQADSRPEPGLLEQAAAAMRIEADRVEIVQRQRRDEAYLPLAQALVERGIDQRDLLNDRLSVNLGIATIGDAGMFNRERIWREAKRLGIEGLPESQEEFERAIYRRQGGRDEDHETLARGGGVAGTVAQFAGGIVGSFADPINIATLPIGGGAKTIAGRILSEAAIGASVEAVQALGPNPAAYARMGEEYGLAEAAQDIALAAAGGAAFSGAVEIAPRVARRIDAAGMRTTAPVRRRFDQFFADRDLARALADVPAEQLTPEQAAARAIFSRELELDDASPYARTYAGDDAHRARLREAGEALAEGRAPAGFDMGRYLALTRSAESGGNDAAQADRSSATGRYQFLTDTWIEFYRRASGETGESREAILRKRTDGATQERVMRAFTQANVDALRRAGVAADEGAAYLAHFLGVGDAIKVLRAAPDTPIGELVTRASINANPAVFNSIGSTSELLAWARRKMGQRAEGIAARPETGEPIGAPLDDPLLAAARAEEADLELARLRTSRFRDEMVELMRPIVDNRAVSLNRPASIAEALGLETQHITDALDRLVAEGSISRTRSGVYRRAVREGPEDMLLFIARKGGIAYDGLGPKARALGMKGDNLRNTGALDTFVPRGGPLLRPSGRGVDELGELLWDAGYFGPPAVTLRPDENTVLAAVEAAARSGQKVYSVFDDAPAKQAPAVREGQRFQNSEHEEFEMTRWSRASERLFGHALDDGQLLAAIDIERELPPWRATADATDEERMETALWEVANRELADAYDDLYAETGDEFYDTLAWQFETIARDAASREGAAVEGGGAGSAGIPRDAGEGAPRGGAGAGDAGPAQLGPAAADALDATPAGTTPSPENPRLDRFDDPAGEAIHAAATSDWHDIRAQLTDPAIAARLREEARLRAAAPLRGGNITGQQQDGVHSFDPANPNLFDAADQPTFDLDDGKGPRSVDDIQAEIEADRAGIDAIRACLE